VRSGGSGEWGLGAMGRWGKCEKYSKVFSPHTPPLREALRVLYEKPMSASTPGDATCFMPGDPSTLRVQQSPIAGNRQDGGCFTAVAPLCRGTLTLQKPLARLRQSLMGDSPAPTPLGEWGLGARGPLWGWGREPPVLRAASPPHWLTATRLHTPHTPHTPPTLKLLVQPSH
jgi:hypothetical protein